MIETILISLIFCKIKKLNIRELFKSWTIYPILIMEVICIILQINIFMKNYIFLKYVNILKVFYLCSYLPMIFSYNQYIAAILGSVFVSLGGILNDIAIKANNGYMPVFPSLSYITGYANLEAFEKIRDIHILGNLNTKLKFLTDIFDIGYSILSLGDIFIRGFVFIVIYNTVKNLNQTNDKVIKGD